MDSTILAYLRDRLEAVEGTTNPHLCRWTNLDRFMVSLAVKQAECGAEALPTPIEYQDAREEVWVALRAFLLEFSEFRSARQISEVLSAGLEATWLWDALLERADELMRLERELKK